MACDECARRLDSQDEVITALRADMKGLARTVAILGLSVLAYMWLADKQGKASG